MINKIKKYRKEYVLRRKYCTGKRCAFYLLAGQYLPEDKKSIIVDIGSGDGQFAEVLNIASKFLNYYFLDSNESSVMNLKNEYGEKHVLNYKIPNRLPFKDREVNYIHCSHVVEHLCPDELYLFLKEVDRVLASNGVFIISAPLLWTRFYDDLSHVKPYNPSVFIKYLSLNKSKTRTGKILSNSYELVDCVYRYRIGMINDYNYYGNKYFVLDLLFYAIKIMVIKAGFRRYVKNGYTIIFKKNVKY